MINIYKTGKYIDPVTGIAFDPCTCEELFFYNDVDYLFYDSERKIIWTPLFNEGIAYTLEKNELKHFFDNVHNALINRTLSCLQYADYALKNCDRIVFQEWLERMNAIEEEHKDIDKKREEILTKYFNED